MKNELSIFSQRLYSLRKQYNYTQQKLAEISKVSRRSIQRYEKILAKDFKNTSVAISTANILLLAQTLDVSAEYLLFGEENMDIYMDTIKKELEDLSREEVIYYHKLSLTDKILAHLKLTDAFIDEIHNVIKAGGAEGAIDASNILKPYLSRNEIQIIGATTEDEFQTIFEKDKALKRRFQIIKMLPSSKEETLTILLHTKNLYEKHYNITIDDNLLPYIVNVSDNYLPTLFFPDKALDILDNSCVIANKKLTMDNINSTIENYYKINVNMSNKSDLALKKIKEKIVGQEEALEKIQQALTLVDKNIYDKDKPLLSMLFIGPSGVGKTEISKIIGETYFSNENIIYFDMSSYQEFGSLNKLIGYSSDNNSKLVRELKAHPKSLIILDEIEKASNEVLDFFLQIFDQGFFDSSKGERIDCKNVMIIMTSNYGFDSNLSMKLNLNNNVLSENSVLKKLQNRFRYEFLSRIDEIVVFSFLNNDIQKEIAKNYLNSLGMEFSCLDDVLIHSKEEYDKFGARLIKRDCKKAILNKFKEEMKNYNFLK